MLLNYLKLSLRLLIRNPFFTLINVGGLAIGFTSFFVLWQYSTTELKTDRHLKDFERIGRIGFSWSWGEDGQSGHITFSISNANIPPQLAIDFPEVESYVRISEQGGFFQNDLHSGHGARVVIARRTNGEEHIFKEDNLAYADRNFFDFFGIPLISGDASTVLAGVNFVAISQSTAKKYFGNNNPIGQELTLNDTIALNVTGVYENLQHNSHFNYDMIISNEGLLAKWSNAVWGGTQNLVKLRTASFKDFENKIKAKKEKYWAYVQCNGCTLAPFVQPLKEIAFSQGFIGDETSPQKSRPLLLTLGTIAIVILVMAWINYLNLSISRLSNRMKEFATRRVNGATARDLIVQFLIEAAFINVIAIGISLTILQVIPGPLDLLFDIHIAELWSTKIDVGVVLFLSIISGILITGLYPAYVCIKRHPRDLFRMGASPQSKGVVSSILTTFQFAAATVLILWTFVVYLQLNFILHQDPGFNRDNIITIDGPITKQDNYEHRVDILVNQLKNLPDIRNATLSRYVIGEPGNKPGSIKTSGATLAPGAECNGVDENFIPLFGLKLVAGRNFVKDDRNDVVIISTFSANGLGFKKAEDAVGTKVQVVTGDWGGFKEAEVIGVIEDYRRFSYFNFSSANTTFAEGGRGLFLTYKNKLFPELTSDNIAVNIKMENTDETIRTMEQLYKTFFPGNVFEWRFLDDHINQVYTSETVMRNQILMFTILAIGIACLGLVAMMSQKIVEKTKEIGIRKILGAKSRQIGKILIHATVLQLVVASMAGIPVAYYLKDQYLQKYSEQITISWWYYAIPIGILMFILFSTISIMLWKAVRRNPVETLKYE